jgi:mannose-6-phosphate isomerase-like protein (cupin superfamily)
MLKVSRESAEHVESHGPVEDRHQDGDGYTINFLSFATDVDATPLLKGMPGDQCQCPHWGYVIKGRMTYMTDDGEHVVEAGDAFYLPPGHVPRAAAGTEFVQFSPTERLDHVSQHMTEAANRMQGAGAPG